MRSHERHHRRQGRNAFPDPAAIADALADAFANPFADPEPQRTAVSIVYITASPTFDGPIGGYKTLGPNGEDLSDSSSKATTTRKQDSSILADSKSKTQTTLSTTTGLPSEIQAPTGPLTSSAALLAATGGVPHSTTTKKSSATAASEASNQVTSSGMSTGGKAGLAIGILLLVGAVLAIALFVFKRRKDKMKKKRLEDEKSAMFAASNGRAASIRTNATAPRLSLRPVTQFLPNLGGEKRSSRGNVLTTMAAGASARPQPSPEHNRNNPFGNNAEVIDSTNANGPTPIEMNATPTGSGTVAAAGGAAGLARGASKRVNGAYPMDFTTKNPAMGPPSPSGTEFSQTSHATSTPVQTGTGAAIAAAGGPANTSVHRVQLDFKPSMEDELELRAGQLVRLLHEYDDGWALCIRLDRSQQGVAPRTCLSTRPVKPRPQQNQNQRGSPPGQRSPPGQMYPGSPANGAPRGFAPMNQGRPESPSGGPQYNGQRPQTPQGQGRPMTPQGQGRRNSPPGSASMNNGYLERQPMSSSPPSNFGGPVGRKPVPGQAL